MRILLVAHNVVRGDGQGRINYELVRHALRSGNSVTLVADRVDADLISAGAGVIPTHPILAKPNLVKVWHCRRLADRAVAQVRSNYDIVIGNGYVLTEPHDLNLCQFVHGAWIRSPFHLSNVKPGLYRAYQYDYTKRNARWEKTAYAAARLVVAPSRQIRDELLSIGVPGAKLRVIYNGVDLEEFKPGVVSREELGLPATVPLALFCGDIVSTRKNLDSVLRAVARLPEVHLAVVGATERSPFPQMARELGIAGRVHFAGYRRDVSRFMQACDLFVFPSRYEAGSLVLLEALSSGLPIITARSAGGSELVSEEAGVVLDDAEDVEGLVRAWGRFAGDAQARLAAGRAARLIAEQHSWQHMADEYLGLARERFDAIAHR